MSDSHLLSRFKESGYVMVNTQAMSKMSRERRAALMLHQLVYSIGGTEVDAQALEKWAYPTAFTGPTQEDRRIFLRNPTGRYVRFHPSTGLVTLKRTNKIITAFPSISNDATHSRAPFNRQKTHTHLFTPRSPVNKKDAYHAGLLLAQIEKRRSVWTSGKRCGDDESALHVKLQNLADSIMEKFVLDDAEQLAGGVTAELREDLMKCDQSQLDAFDALAEDVAAWLQDNH